MNSFLNKGAKSLLLCRPVRRFSVSKDLFNICFCSLIYSARSASIALGAHACTCTVGQDAFRIFLFICFWLIRLVEIVPSKPVLSEAKLRNCTSGKDKECEHENAHRANKQVMGSIVCGESQVSASAENVGAYARDTISEHDRSHVFWRERGCHHVASTLAHARCEA